MARYYIKGESRGFIEFLKMNSIEMAKSYMLSNYLNILDSKTTLYDLKYRVIDEDFIVSKVSSVDYINNIDRFQCVYMYLKKRVNAELIYKSNMKVVGYCIDNSIIYIDLIKDNILSFMDKEDNRDTNEILKPILDNLFDYFDELFGFHIDSDSDSDSDDE